MSEQQLVTWHGRRWRVLRRYRMSERVQLAGDAEDADVVDLVDVETGDEITGVLEHEVSYDRTT